MRSALTTSAPKLGELLAGGRLGIPGENTGAVLVRVLQEESGDRTAGMTSDSVFGAQCGNRTHFTVAPHTAMSFAMYDLK